MKNYCAKLSDSPMYKFNLIAKNNFVGQEHNWKELGTKCAEPYSVLYETSLGNFETPIKL